MDLRTSTTLQVLKALSDGEVSSVELLDEMVERADRLDGPINSIIERNLERARAEAAAADDERDGVQRLGPLHGLPMTVKDTWETLGMATCAGSPELVGHESARDADVVRMLRRDGAIIWGKTNVPLFAGDHQTYNDVHGVTNNPWNTSMTAGGSSGGAAAAVACGFTTAEVGSDIGGSIRQPAAFNGVFGLKTTQGLVSGRGHIPGMPGTLRTSDLGVFGPLGRSCGDLRLLLKTITKSRSFGDAPNARLNRSRPDMDIAGMRLGLWADDKTAPIDSEMKQIINDAAADLSSAGAEIFSDLRPETSSERLYEIYNQLLNAEMGAGWPQDRYNKLVDRAAAGGAGSEAARQQTGSYRDWVLADEARWHAEEDWYRVFETVDAVIAPVAPVTAFPHNTDLAYFDRTLTVNGESQPYTNMTFWSSLATMPGLPAVTIPFGQTSAGLPVGVQIIGARWSELKILDVAEEIASVLGMRFTPPPLAG